MAANCVRKAVQSTSGSAKTLLTRSSSSPLTFKACKFSGIPSVRTTPYRLSAQKLFPFRHPVELASLQSLMPLHSVTAMALFNSLLSLHNQTWGCLSEGDLNDEFALFIVNDLQLKIRYTSITSFVHYFYGRGRNGI